MWLFAGLGNPGQEYEGTRHNAGFRALKRMLEKYKVSPVPFHGKGLIWEGISVKETEEKKFLLLQPLSFMNCSGKVIRRAFEQFDDIAPQEIVIMYDDFSIPLGTIRWRRGGAAGGHNGMESIIHEMQSKDIQRIKMGIGPAIGRDTRDFVLGKFSGRENEVFENVLNTSNDWVETVLWESFSTGMNRFNGVSYE